MLLSKPPSGLASGHPGVDVTPTYPVVYFDLDSITESDYIQDPWKSD